MATIGAGSLPETLEITTGAANVLTEIAYGNAVERITVHFVGTAGKVAAVDGLTDGGALGANDSFPVIADQGFEIDVRAGTIPGSAGNRRNSIFVTTAAGATLVHVLAEGGEQK